MFYCPVHKTSEYVIKTIDAMIESWDEVMCPECEALFDLVDPLKRWFYSGKNLAMPEDLKARMKQEPIELYSISHLFGLVDDYECFRYLDNEPLYINIHKLGYFSNKKESAVRRNPTRMGVHGLKKIRYETLGDLVTLPIERAKDDDFIRKVLAKPF